MSIPPNAGTSAADHSSRHDKIGMSADSVVMGVNDRIEETLAHIEACRNGLLESESRGCVASPYAVPKDFCLSVVIPVFNEEATIGTLLSRVLDLSLPLEIIVVDDHSTDGTLKALEPFSRHPAIRIVAKGHNEGKGAALRTGFAYATGNVVIVQDADLEYNPADIPQIVRPIVEGRADVVYGSRFLADRHSGSSAIHQFGNRLLTLLSNLVTGLRLSDMETCYKAFRRELLTGIPLRQDRFGFEPEITAKIARRHVRVSEVPVQYQARAWNDGKKIGMRDAVNAIYCILRYAILD